MGPLHLLFYLLTPVQHVQWYPHKTPTHTHTPLSKWPQRKPKKEATGVKSRLLWWLNVGEGRGPPDNIEHLGVFFTHFSFPLPVTRYMARAITGLLVGEWPTRPTRRAQQWFFVPISKGMCTFGVCRSTRSWPGRKIPFWTLIKDSQYLPRLPELLQKPSTPQCELPDLYSQPQ